MARYGIEVRNSSENIISGSEFEKYSVTDVFWESMTTNNDSVNQSGGWQVRNISVDYIQPPDLGNFYMWGKDVNFPNPHPFYSEWTQSKPPIVIARSDNDHITLSGFSYNSGEAIPGNWWGNARLDGLCFAGCTTRTYIKHAMLYRTALATAAGSYGMIANGPTGAKLYDSRIRKFVSRAPILITATAGTQIIDHEYCDEPYFSLQHLHGPRKYKVTKYGYFVDNMWKGGVTSWHLGVKSISNTQCSIAWVMEGYSGANAVDLPESGDYYRGGQVSLIYGDIKG